MTEIVNHSRSTAMELSVKILQCVCVCLSVCLCLWVCVCVCGWVGGGRLGFYVATTLAVSSAVVCTRFLFSPREGFLTHQCNIKIKRIQRRKNETMTQQQEITEMLKQKKTNSWTPGSRPESEHQAPTGLLKSLQTGAVIESDPPACNQRGKQSYYP